MLKLLLMSAVPRQSSPSTEFTHQQIAVVVKVVLLEIVKVVVLVSVVVLLWVVVLVGVRVIEKVVVLVHESVVL